MSAIALSLPDLVWLVPVLPLLTLGWIALRVMLGRAVGDAAERPTARVSAWGMWLVLGFLLALDAWAWQHGWPGRRSPLRWFAGTGWQGYFSFLLDQLSLTVATLVAAIGWLVMRFSANYLHREAGFHRFFILLNLFLAGMLLVVLSGNGLLAFVGWEMCGIASFLLIGYAWHRPLASAHALYAFVTNRAGDAGFLLALGLAAAWLGSFEWLDLTRPGALGMVNARLLVIGFVLAALVKSAQVPFTPWIARALEGPTPSSAIFYGALLIHAGVFLMLRLYPLLAQVPDVQAGLLLAGLVTALYAWLVGLVQSDVKSALIFATVMQLGLMFAAIGLGWTDWALLHLCLHAVWRTWQFLHAPSWLTLTARRPPPPPRWLCQQQWLYTAALQRFWLDRLAIQLFVKPTQAFAQDVRALEDDFIDRAIGQPGAGKAVTVDHPLVRADGLPGKMLAALSARAQAFEDHLLLRERGGLAERLLLHLGNYLRVVEHLLEEPRYLMLAVMATFVVIL